MKYQLPSWLSGFLLCLPFLFSSCGPDSNTETSKQFNEKRFREIRVGDDWNAVKQQIGPPLATYENDRQQWSEDQDKIHQVHSYSRARNSSKLMKAYTVYTDSKGKVSGVQEYVGGGPY